MKMTFEPVKMEDVQGGEYQALVREFLASGHTSVRVNLNGTAPQKAVNGFTSAIKHHNLACRVSRRGDDIYLIRRDGEK